MKRLKNILVLNGGGLSPSLNPTLYGVASRAKKLHYKIFGGIGGWASLVQHGEIIDLTKLNIEIIKNRGGALLRSSRTNPIKIPGGIDLLKEKIKKYQLDGLIAIGGDDTLMAAAKLHKDYQLPVIGLPKTVDNDLPLTYFAPGFPTAAFYAAKLAAETKQDSAYTYSRVYIIEMYGAMSGWLTCAAALGGADIIIPPEWQFDLGQIISLVKKKYEANGNYCVIAVSKETRIKGINGRPEQQPDGFGNIRNEYVSLALQERIQSQLGLTTKIIIPMNYLQSGNPIKLDIEIGHKLGQAGVDLIKQQQTGQAVIITYANKKFSLKGVSLDHFMYKGENLDNSQFNRKTMQPTTKYLNYLNTLIGDFEFIDNEYQKLCRKIRGKSN
ncbi:MAG: hypothetical protein COT81_02620 [Candidatus Buchananbacteria bacterium CG10_big_fil_rev_8_21_14_0_10_42_9]|uniref:Phosphofructokinase domain-containing protein n=1 Tax=Candidatus Buchananbacteria bacterium CG10_big_fil_rev_8_21_14_0_10_42_9 TaxID=1974526 RepID=A0A2H0W1B6_9BACT|nr:MAG: hypothetical protein COT81_02620 [Candidatus Buchananbacteria bacterium CG10_big_fil_rev_8_21_14_0_10_42_9]